MKRWTIVVMSTVCSAMAYADINVTQGSGKTVATDSVASREYQTIKIIDGATGGTSSMTVTAGGAIPVVSTGVVLGTGANTIGAISNSGFNVNNVPSVTLTSTYVYVTNLTSVTFNGIPQPNYTTNLTSVTFSGQGAQPFTSTSVYVANVTTSPIQIQNGAGSLISVGYQSGGGSVPVSLQTIGPIVSQGVLTTTNTVVVSSGILGYSDVVFTVYPGTTAVGTSAMNVVFEVSPDSGAVWEQTVATRKDFQTMASSYTLSTTTTTWIADVFGMTNFRVRAANFQVGVASVTIIPTVPPNDQQISATNAILISSNGFTIPNSIGYTTTASSMPVNVLGGRISYSIPTTVSLSSVTVSTSSTGDLTQIAGVGGQTIRIWRLFLVVSAATNITFKEGLTDALTGPMNMVANGSITFDFIGGEPWFVTNSGNGFVINQSGTAQISGRIYYTQS